jgi:hypothetical protein
MRDPDISEQELLKIVDAELERACRAIDGQPCSEWKSTLASAIFAANIVVGTYIKVHELGGHEVAQKWLGIFTQDVVGKMRQVGVQLSAVWVDAKESPRSSK